MNKVKYNEVKGRYTEVFLNEKSLALFSPELVYDPENKLHIYYAVYDDDHDMPYRILVEPNDKVYGSIISPFPLAFNNGAVNIFAHDFLLRCVFVNPDDVVSWIDEYVDCEDSREEDILYEIREVLYRFESRGPNKEEVKKFFTENSFYFAVLMREQMDTGTVSVCIPENHVVWVNNSGRAYDANGRYKTDSIMVPPYDKIITEKYLNKDDVKVSEEDCEILAKKWGNYFPNA